MNNLISVFCFVVFIWSLFLELRNRTSVKPNICENQAIDHHVVKISLCPLSCHSLILCKIPTFLLSTCQQKIPLASYSAFNNLCPAQKFRNFKNCLAGSPFGLVLLNNFEHFDLLAQNYSENLKKWPNFWAGHKFLNALYIGIFSCALNTPVNIKSSSFSIGFKFILRVIS